MTSLKIEHLHFFIPSTYFTQILLTCIVLFLKKNYITEESTLGFLKME